MYNEDGDWYESKQCDDCMKDRDYCPDCCDGNLYKSPDSYGED